MPRNAVVFIIIHPQISKWVTAEIILVSPPSILVGDWLQRQRHFLAWSLYVRSKWGVRHRLHCLVLTDTKLYNFRKGKTYSANQRWRHTTCLQHPRRLLPLSHPSRAKEYALNAGQYHILFCHQMFLFTICTWGTYHQSVKQFAWRFITGFAQAWKVLEFRGLSWKVLEN